MICGFTMLNVGAHKFICTCVVAGYLYYQAFLSFANCFVAGGLCC